MEIILKTKKIELNKVINTDLEFNKEDILKYMKYLGHKEIWVEVFKPNINGETPNGLLYRGFYKKTQQDSLINTIKKYNDKGLICFAINEHKGKDTSIKTIDKINSLLIDIDVRKKFKEKYVSLKEHHDLALETAYDIQKYLEDKGFLVSMIIDSGNGAHIYIHIDENLDKEYIKKRKEILKSDSKTKDKELSQLLKSTELYRRIETFEKELKDKFNNEILEIDNITKDLNRRMKIPGVINKKDFHQSEDRLSRILYFKEDFNADDRQNVLSLEKYEPKEHIEIEKVQEKKEIITTKNQEQILYRLKKFLNSKKERDKELKDLINANNLNERFNGDRSNAEQALVNSLYFRGFRTLEQINACMQLSKIGKWSESNQSYKYLTFEKAEKFFEEKKAEKDKKKNNFLSHFNKYVIYYVTDESKTKYLVYNKDTTQYFEKHGDENLGNFLYLDCMNNDVDITQIELFYPDSKKKIESLLVDFMKDQKLIKIINDISFKPINEKEYVENGKKYFNTYAPNEYLILSPNKEDINIKKQCPHIYQLIHNICGKEKEGVEYYLNLLAFIIQNPHIKTGKMVVFFGEEAAGKGINYDQILKPLFGEYAGTISSKDLDTGYTGFLSKKIVLYANEVQNKKEYGDSLKNWITESSISINHKFGNMEEEKTYFTIFADVNGNNPLVAGQRRGVYFRSKTLGGSLRKAPEIGERLSLNIPKELSTFAQFLKNRETSFDLINTGYETQAKEDVLDSIKTLEEQFINEMFLYKDFKSFVNSIMGTGFDDLLEIGKYIKDGYLEITFLLNCYNSYRYKKGIRNIASMHKFSWIYEKLNVNRNDKKQVFRNYNSEGKNVFWIRLDLITKNYPEKEKEIKEILVR